MKLIQRELAEKHHNHRHVGIKHFYCKRHVQKCLAISSMLLACLLHDASSCHVLLDVHQQTTVLVTGNHFTAPLTESYLHKLPRNT